MVKYTDPQKLDPKVQLKEVSFFMSKKYSFDFKLQLVKEYLSGGGGYEYLSRKYHISQTSLIREWVAQYKQFGEKGLWKKRGKQKYSSQFKYDAVQCYLTTEISYRELARQLQIPNSGLIVQWVSAFRKYGIEGISEKPKGRPTKVLKNEKKSTEAEVPVTSAEKDRLKELEEENLKLKIEIAFLKELRRLRLEEEAMKKSQGLSAASEENTD